MPTDNRLCTNAIRVSETKDRPQSLRSGASRISSDGSPQNYITLRNKSREVTKLFKRPYSVHFEHLSVAKPFNITVFWPSAFYI